MPSVLGTELAKLLDPNLIIVFTTAYSEFAVEGFNLNASDYLLKPFTFERFEQCIAKVQEIYSFKNAKIVGEETIVFNNVSLTVFCRNIASSDIIFKLK